MTKAAIKEGDWMLCTTADPTVFRFGQVTKVTAVRVYYAEPEDSGPSRFCALSQAIIYCEQRPLIEGLWGNITTTYQNALRHTARLLESTEYIINNPPPADLWKTA